MKRSTDILLLSNWVTFIVFFVAVMVVGHTAMRRAESARFEQFARGVAGSARLAVLARLGELDAAHELTNDSVRAAQALAGVTPETSEDGLLSDSDVFVVTEDAAGRRSAGTLADRRTPLPEAVRRSVLAALDTTNAVVSERRSADGTFRDFYFAVPRTEQYMHLLPAARASLVLRVAIDTTGESRFRSASLAIMGFLLLLFAALGVAEYLFFARRFVGPLQREVSDRLRSEEEKRTILDNISDRVSYIDREMRVRWANKALLDTLGLAQQDVVGKRCYELWHDRDALCDNCPVKVCFDTGVEARNDVETADGRFWLLRAYPVIGADGAVTGVVELARDVSERRRHQREQKLHQEELERLVEQRTAELRKAYEARQESEKIFRLFAENAFDGVNIARYNPENRTRQLVYCNDRYVALSGYSRQQLESAEDLNALVTLDPPPARRADEHECILKGIPFSGAASWKRPDGRENHYEYSAVSVIRDGIHLVIGIDRETTERNRTEAALRQSEEMLAMAQAIAHIGSFSMDTATGQFWFSREMFHIMGLPPDEPAPPFPDGYHSIIHEDDIAMLRKLVAHSVRTGEGHEAEIRIFWPDGAMRYALVRAEAVRDAGGKVVRTVGTLQDITGQNLAEQKLAQSEAKFATAFNSNPALMAIITGSDGRFVEANDAYIKALGHARDKIIGRTDIELNIWADPAQRAEALRRIETDGFLRGFQMQFRTRTGEAREALLSVEKAVINGEDRLITSAIDITERARSRRQLTESEARYRGLFEGSPVAMLEEDCSEFRRRIDALRAQGVTDILTHFAPHLAAGDLRGMGIRVVSANEALAALFGMPLRADAQDHIAEVFTPESAATLADQVKAMIAGERRFECETVVRTLAGEQRHVAGAFQLLPGHEHTWSRALVTFVDITERKRAKHQRRQLTDGLSSVLAAATELISCADLDSLYRRTVELARERLGIERCALFLINGDEIRGAYGTDRHGLVADEAGLKLRRPASEWRKRQVDILSLPHPWLRFEGQYTDFDGREMRAFGGGWIVETPVATASKEPLAVLFNDTALTHVPLDELQQDLLTVYASLVASIIEHKRAETQLRESDELYASTVNALDDWIHVVDRDLCVVLANNALVDANRRAGIEADPVGRRVTDALLLRSDHLAQEFKSVFATGKPLSTVDEMVIGDEAVIIRRRRIPVIVDGAAVRVVTVITNITAQEQSERALRESEERYRALYRGLPLPTYTWKHEHGRFVFIDCNDAAAAQSPALSTQQFLGRTDIELYPDQPLVTAPLHHCFKHRTSLQRELSYRSLATGEARTISCTYGFVPPDLIVVHSEDVTERRQAEAQLRGYEAQLRSLASEVSLAEERERRRIASDLHDHVCQTLAIAKIKLGVMQSTIADGSLIEQCDAIRLFLDQTIHAARTLTFDLSPPVLYELGIAAALEWLAEQLQQQGVNVVFEGAPPQQHVKTDIAIVLFRAVRELLMNAVKHARARTVTIQLDERPGALDVCVRDDGTGFDPDTPRPGGARSGYGLFSIRERIRHLGGSLHIVSGAGGTIVRIAAPLAPDEAAADAAEGPPAADAPKNGILS